MKKAGSSLRLCVGSLIASCVLMKWRRLIHPSSTLIQVLDDYGRTVDFSNTVIIMTSKLGADHLLAGLMDSSSMKIARERVMEEVRKHFSPKLLSSLDEIVVFDPLSHDQLRKVAWLQMKDVAVRLAERGIALAVADAALDVVLSEAYDPMFGAKPTRRWLIREDIDESSTVYIDAMSWMKQLSFRVEKNGGMMNASTRQRCIPARGYDITSLWMNKWGSPESDEHRQISGSNETRRRLAGFSV